MAAHRGATDIEARHVLQAWTFLRQVGIAPDAADAKDVLGVVVSVPVQHGHDVLGAYRDDSVRYINFSGAAVVVDEAPPTAGDAGRELLEQGRILVTSHFGGKVRELRFHLLAPQTRITH